ncbi:MAG TPA: sulfite oxidase-like oxidoreductase [Nitrospiria bacterium]|jgi:DMSO/TMAO reductase YedYZ molybdopterin-dependent catalytic subunit|nr:sulfite oxidase-like oxidoreductase [Nitrospiria bacterium]
MTDPKDKLIRKKEEWAREKRGLTPQAREEGLSVRQNPDAPSIGKPRLPPGQHLAKGFPVLDLGHQPEVPLERWSLDINGLVENPVTWDWRDFMAQPQIRLVSDFHCVTTWSTFDNRWEGVSFKRLLEVVRPKPGAKHVLFASYDGYSTNVPLSVLNDDDVLIAHRWNDQPLTREHGGPARMVIPKRYGWKSAKWIKEMVFLAEDRPGFWEVRGYSNTADPWTEDRYS